MKKHNNTGRSTGDGRFVQLGEWLMKSVAWQYASVYERALYVEIKRRYTGGNNGDIALSHREAETLLRCSNKPVAAAFAGLQDKGFIIPRQKGSFNWKTAHDGGSAGRATRWILTEAPQDVPQRVLSGGTKDFMKWTPDPEFKKKSRYAESVPLVCPERTIKATMVRPEHTIEAGVYAYGTR
jgi:hypothetical protein